MDTHRQTGLHPRRAGASARRSGAVALLTVLLTLLSALPTGCSSSEESCVCTPNLRLCRGDTLVTCLADCQNWREIDCTLRNQICQNESCVAGPTTDGDNDPAVDRDAESDTVEDDETVAEETGEESPGDPDPNPDIEPDADPDLDEDAAADPDPSDDLVADPDPGDEADPADVSDIADEGDGREIVTFTAHLQGAYDMSFTTNLWGISSRFSETVGLYGQMYGSDACRSILRASASSSFGAVRNLYAELIASDGSLTAKGETLCAIIESHRTDMLRSPWSGSAVDDLWNLLKAVDIEGVYTFYAEPDPLITEGQARLEIGRIGVTDPAGGCSTATPCNIDLAFIASDAAPAVDVVGVRESETRLTLDLHRFPLKLSRFVVYLLRYLVGPTRYKVDPGVDFEQFVGWFIGGRTCFTTHFCCLALLDAIDKNTNQDLYDLLSASLPDGSSACEALVPHVGALLENHMDGIERSPATPEGMFPFSLATEFGNPGYIGDLDFNGEIELWGADAGAFNIQMRYYLDVETISAVTPLRATRH